MSAPRHPRRASAAINRAASMPRVWVALFFAALTLIGLITAGDYGLACDEPAERVILMENLHEYAIRLFGSTSEAARYYESQGINRISESIERDHGECAYYPIAPLTVSLAGSPDKVMTLWHMYTWLLFMLGVAALYGLSRELGVSRPIACLAALLFVLCPRFFAEGHYNNKDIVLLSLTLATLYAGARLCDKPTAPRALLFALAGAMAANTKIAGVFAWGLMGLCAIIRLTARREWSARAVRAALCAIFGLAVFYAALTPALLADPAEYLSYIIKNATGFTRWTGVVIFKGARYEPAASPLPRSYLPYTMLATLPLYATTLCALGQACGLIGAIRGLEGGYANKGIPIRSLSSNDSRVPISTDTSAPARAVQITDSAIRRVLASSRALAIFALTLMWLIPLAFVVLRQPVMYNGWRHFYFIFAGLAPFMALGLQAIWRFVCRYGRVPRALAALACAALIAFQAVTLAVNHPYQYAYYNPIARANAQTDMELDYWDVSTLNALRKLLAIRGDEVQPLIIGARDDMSMFGVTHAYDVLRADEKARLVVSDDPNAPYIFSNTTYALIYETPPPEGYSELITITSYGSMICIVYERE